MVVMSIKEHPPHLHVPVLLDSTLQLLDPKEGENYLDLTAGYGGHARAILAATSNYADSVLVDRDEYALRHLRSFADQGVRLVQGDFVSAAKELIEEARRFRLILVDLGVSSPQLDQGERGFSFRHTGPLDMRMDRRQSVTAADIVNTASETELTDIIRRFGDEKPSMARRIAGAIVASRPLHGTVELAQLIENLIVVRGKIHPATRTFQALRIAVNQELTQVEQLLPLLPQLLEPGGRVGIISFHSLEDRLVKRYFAEQAASGYEAELEIVTKKPISGALRDVHNPRSRSAKLRVAVKK